MTEWRIKKKPLGLFHFWSRLECEELHWKTELIDIDETSMTGRKLLELVNAVLDDFQRGRTGTEHINMTYWISVVFIILLGDYLELLAVIPSKKYIALENGNVDHIPVNPLDGPPSASSLWREVNIRTLSQQVCQSNDLQYLRLVSSVASGRLIVYTLYWFHEQQDYI